jgi:hypothetical protein
MQGYLIAVPDRHLAAFGVGQVVDSQPGRHAAVLYMAWSGQVQRACEKIELWAKAFTTGKD